MRSLALSVLALAACTDGLDDVDVSYTQATSDLIGANNAAVYKVAGSSITNVDVKNWGSDWSHVVPFTALDGTSMVFLYARELGTAKLLTVASDGSMTTVASIADLQLGWDEVVADTKRGSLLFYRHNDSTLRVMNATSSGSFTVALTQSIPAPSDIPHPGWDYMRSIKLGPTGELVFYDRLGGEALFMTWLPGLQIFIILAHSHGWQTIWDQIETGDINGDGVDDIVLYSAETGDLKVVTYDSSGNSTGQIAMSNAEQSAGAQLAVADFGGSVGKDVLLYQVEGSASFNDGRLRIWTDVAGGTHTPQVSVAVQDGWTHVVPVSLGSGKKAMLFYSNQRVVKVRVHPVGATAASIAGFTFTGDQPQLDKLAAALRKTYAGAGIAFDVAFGSALVNPTIGSFACGAPHNDDVHIPDANTFIASHVSDDELPIMLPLDPPSTTDPHADDGSAGCSGLQMDFVKSSYYYGKIYSSGYGFDTDKHYAHEVGHFMGLRHVDVPDKTPSDTTKRLRTDGTIDTLDTDQDDDDPYLALLDTPPVLSQGWWTDLYGTVTTDQDHDAS